jgi:hypothetical protein
MTDARDSALNWNPAIGDNTFYEFCSNLTSTNASSNVTVMDSKFSYLTEGKKWKNLGKYAEWIKEYVVKPGCPAGEDQDSSACFGTQNKTYWAQDGLETGASRAWLYQVSVGDKAKKEVKLIDSLSGLHRVRLLSK